MLKQVSKFFLEIFPSVVATVVGAYIVNHYIIAKPADPPKAAVASTPESARDIKPDVEAKAESSAEDVEKGKGSAEKRGDKTSAEKPAAAETKRPASNIRDKADRAIAKAAAAVNAASPPADTPSATEEKRDANELARAALDRLRGPVDASRPVAPPARPVEQPRLTVAATPPQPHVQQQVQPLPPAALVTAPTVGTGASPAAEAPATHTERPFFAAKPMPPAEIPLAPPLDLRATVREHTSIAEDVVSTAKSVFHAVIPR